MKLFCILLAIGSFNTAYAQWSGFQIKQRIPVEGTVFTLATAIANDDQHRDLIVLTDNTTKGLVYRGNRDGNFSSPLSFQKRDQYRLLQTGDIDKDGIEDLIISSYWENGFRIYWGNNQGHYTEGRHYALTGHGKNLVVSDLNNDNNPDIAALSGGSGQPITLHVFPGSGSRELATPTVYSSVLHTDTRITIVDKNQDGLRDIMVASSFPWFVIFYQEPDGSFTPRYWPVDVDLAQPFTSDHYLADFNNDSRDDVLSFYFNEGFRLHEGLQDTLFSEAYHAVPTAPRLGRVYTADLNGDGNMDIIMENFTEEYEPTNTFLYMLGNGDFSFREPVPFDVGGPIQRLFLTDLNTDSYPDVVAAFADQTLVTILNNGLPIGNDSDAFALNIYPNPFSTDFQIALPQYPAFVTIYDPLGRVFNEFTITEVTNVPTSGWPSGLYMVKAINDKQVGFKRIIRE